MKTFDCFTPANMAEFEKDAKLGILATLNPEGLPHLTLITSLQAKSPRELIWGQFCEGMSKTHVTENPRTGFLIMNMAREFWRGKALWTGGMKEGVDFEMINAKPLFRYNSYFGVHTVHSMKLVETFGREKLPIGAIMMSSLASGLVRGIMKSGNRKRIMNQWTQDLFNSLSALKFLSFVDPQGFPVIIPVIQCRAADSGLLIFPTGAFGKDLGVLKKNTPVAVFGLTLSMEFVLVRGVFTGLSRPLGIRTGAMDVDWVYNPMPPVRGQVYPAEDITPIVEF